MSAFQYPRYIVPLILSVCLWISACKNVESDIGSSFFQGHANVLEVDTMTVKMETVYLDSIPTSSTATILLGSYQDPVYGTVSASSYLQLGAPDDRSIPASAVYDSLCFMLRPNRYFLGDTTREVPIAIYPLSELIDPGETGAEYNTTRFSRGSAALGSWTGRIYPGRTDSISIRLSDLLGRTLLSAIIDNPDNLSTDNLFANYYLKGLMLESTGGKALLGFHAGDSSGFMRLHYHLATDVKTSLHTDFSIADPVLQFNHISTDRSGTLFGSLGSDQKAMNADVTGYRSVLQPMSNMAIRISFPYLRNLQHLGRYVDILSAGLTLHPEAGTYTSDIPLPPAVALCITQDYYHVLDTVIGSGGVAYGNLITDYSYHNTSYTYDLSSYLISEMQVKSDYDKTSLLLLPPLPDYNTTFRKLVIDNQSAKSSGITLSVQLVTYDTK
ncbi:DUF4270 family protein [Compostibacter hankyongensis]|uniref:DUF4270 family protein n=1 Tax=Compostibacter hankyongensis TaxID=1007089 RepID=A0ABP8FL49_9BACT